MHMQNYAHPLGRTENGSSIRDSSFAKWKQTLSIV